MAEREIFIFILGESPASEKMFSVAAPVSMSVHNWKKSVYAEAKSRLEGVAAIDLTLWKLKQAIPLANVDNETGDLGQDLSSIAEKMLPAKKILYYFALPPVEESLHVILVPSLPSAGHKRPPSNEVDDPDARKQEIKKLRDDAIRAGVEGRAPSSAADPKNMVLEQRDHPIANGRPQSQVGPPIYLYHPVFLEFHNKVHEMSVEIPVDFQLMVYTFLTEASMIYRTEKLRRDAVDNLLAEILGFPIMATQLLDGTSNDGCITAQTGSHKALLLLLETKNEVGTGGCDPSPQAAYSARKFWASEKDKHFRDKTCCPTFLLSMAGPWLQIQGFILTDTVIVQPLTDYIWLGGVPNVGAHIEKVAKVLFALSHSLKTLECYYTNLPTPTADTCAYLFPHINQYSTGQQMVTFAYNARLFPRGSRAVFSAQDQDGHNVVVKFTPTYNVKAHQLLAEAELAPALYHASDCIAAPGYMMVVMEMLTGKDATQLDMQKLTKERYKKVERAITLLHSSGYVFGDLRLVNIVITGADDVRLVDFDWCGKEDVGRYPITLNDTGAIPWPDDVGRCKPMKKKHDLEMLSRLRDSP